MTFVVNHYCKSMACLPHQGESVFNRPQRGSLRMNGVNLAPVVGRGEHQVSTLMCGLTDHFRKIQIEADDIGKSPKRTIDHRYLAISWDNLADFQERDQVGLFIGPKNSPCWI